MSQSSTIAALRGRFSALFMGLTLLGTAGCGAEANSAGETVGDSEEAINGGWVNLDLINGWSNFNGTANPPAIGKVNGVVTFRGAIKATNPTSPVPFTLEAAKFASFRVTPTDNVFMRTSTSGGRGAELFLNSFGEVTSNTNRMYIYPDGVTPGNIGTCPMAEQAACNAAKAFTSLDGVSFDVGPGSGIVADPAWGATYGLRRNEDFTPGHEDSGAYVKVVDGFARFQGTLTKFDPSNLSGFLFKLTDPAVIPTQMVMVPLDLGGATPGQTFGALTFYPTGEVYVNGNPFAANSLVSFEGVWFSKTLQGNQALSLATGWHAYSARSVKVGNYGGVIRFQGAISGGSTAKIASVPNAMAPTKTVRLIGVANGPVPVTIVVSPPVSPGAVGVVTFEGIPTNVASLYLSLDGVSYAL